MKLSKLIQEIKLISPHRVKDNKDLLEFLEIHRKELNEFFKKLFDEQIKNSSPQYDDEDYLLRNLNVFEKAPLEMGEEDVQIYSNEGEDGFAFSLDPSTLENKPIPITIAGLPFYYIQYDT